MPDADQSDGRPNDLEAPEVVDGVVAPPAAGQDRRFLATAEFSGPLPPPNVLREYAQVKPGLADIIVNQWERETAHRHKTIDNMTETDRQVVSDYNQFQRRGQWLGFGALLAIFAVTALALILGENTAAVGGIAVGAGYAIAAIFRGYGPSHGTPPPADLSDGNEVERTPESS